MVKCGKCKGKHASAGDVRKCYQGETVGVSHIGNDSLRSKYETKGTPRQSTTVWAKNNQRSFGANESRPTATATVAKATSKQAWLIVDLLRQRAALQGQTPTWDQDEMAAQQMEQSRSEASEAIERLIQEVKDLKAEAPVAKATVPAGRYAIDRDGTIKFYVVSRPTEGRWAGLTFVDIQASDERHSIRSRSERLSILDQIGEDVQGAMERYGRELGHCGHCGRTLTNEVSRERGIGPVCAQKMGW